MDDRPEQVEIPPDLSGRIVEIDQVLGKYWIAAAGRKRGGRLSGRAGLCRHLCLKILHLPATVPVYVGFEADRRRSVGGAGGEICEVEHVSPRPRVGRPTNYRLPICPDLREGSASDPAVPHS